MNTYIKTLASIAVLATFTIITGCATMGKDLVRNGSVNIEKVSSRKATIVFVSVIQEGDQAVLRGEVRSRGFGRGPIPGHIDLEVIGTDGSVLEKSKIDYHQLSSKSTYAKFHATLKAMPPPGSIIRVTHNTRTLSPCEQRYCDGAS